MPALVVALFVQPEREVRERWLRVVRAVDRHRGRGRVDLKLEPGAAFRFKAQPQPGWDGNVDCRFLESEAQRKLSYTWVVGDMDTVVTFTLTPTASGTRLSLVQSGFKPDQKQNFGGARYGWKMMGGKLVDLLGRIA